MAPQVAPTARRIPWLGFVVFPTHRRLKARNAVAFTRRFEAAIARYEAGRSSFAELDASVQGWLNHARYADTWELRRPFAAHPIHAPSLSGPPENFPTCCAGRRHG